MRALMRRSLTVLAIYAIALHGVLWTAVAPYTASATFDPFTIICHSASVAPDQAPTQAPLAPFGCDHCNLCSVTAPPLAPNTTVAVRFETAVTLPVLYPVDVGRHDSIATDPKLARGPPAIV